MDVTVDGDSAIGIFEPKYRLGHPEDFLMFIIYKNKSWITVSRKNKYLILQKEALDSASAGGVVHPGLSGFTVARCSEDIEITHRRWKSGWLLLLSVQKRQCDSKHGVSVVRRDR